MLVYRISKTQYASDLEGTGAKLYGGRWNHIDTPCIYTSQSIALAVLEYSVNVNIDFIPRALSVATFEIDDKKIKELKIKNLPGDWKDVPAPFSTKDLGTKLLKDGVPILKVPSTVVPFEFNFIINPFFDTKHFKLKKLQDFVYDLRIKTV